MFYKLVKNDFFLLMQYIKDYMSKFNFHCLLRILLIVSFIVTNDKTNGQIIKHIDKTESFSYGDWVYKTIEFSDSTTVLKGIFVSKSNSFIYSDRNEYIEIDGIKYSVIENDLPYSYDKMARTFVKGDTIDFTYVFPAIHGINGLYNVKHERFILPVFFIREKFNNLSSDELATYYYSRALNSLKANHSLSSLRYIEEFLKLTKDRKKVLTFLSSNSFYSSNETENLLSMFKQASLYKELDKTDIYQEIIIGSTNENEFNKYFKQQGFLDQTTRLILSDTLYTLNERFVMACIKTFVDNKCFEAASHATSYLCSKQDIAKNIKLDAILYQTFLKSIDLDSICRKKVISDALSYVKSSDNLYSFMFTHFNHIDKYDIASEYGELLFKNASESTLIENVSLLFELAECYVKLKDYANALKYHKLFEEVTSSMKVIDKDLLEKRIMNSLRFINLSDYTRVVVSTEHNKELIQIELGKESQEYANNIFYNAIGYRSIGSDDKAEEYFKEAYQLLTKIDPYDTFSIQSQYYLGLIYMLNKNYDMAYQALQAALSALEHNGNLRLKATLLRLQIELALKMGDYDTMYISMEQLQAALNEEPSIYDQTFLSSVQGDYFLDKEQYRDALKMYLLTESSLHDTKIDSNTDVYINCMADILTIYSLEDEKEMSLHYAKALWNALKGVIFDGIKKLNKNERYKIVELYESKLDLLQSALIKIGLQESNSLLYDIVLSRKGLLLGTDIFYNKKYHQSNASHDTIPCNSSNNDAELLAQIASLGLNEEDLIYNWKDVREGLGRDDIAIEFLVNECADDTTSSQYFALVLTRECDGPSLIPLGRFQDSMWQDEDLYDTNILYDCIWIPILSKYNSVKKIYFAPDGNLHRVAIENIKLPSGELLKEKFQVFRISSSKFIIYDKPSSPLSNNLIYGGLIYSSYSDDISTISESDKIDNRYNVLRNSSAFRGGVKYLPGTKKEVDEITNEMKQKGVPFILYQGEEGTEISFRGHQYIDFEIVHLATHGYFLDETSDNECDFSFLSKTRREKFDVEDKSLLNSGLFFSLANRALISNHNFPEESDGVVTAKELTQMFFGTINLVVLSACQTGLGEIKGDGVFGLQRGFKVAGANSLLMSLWPVDDEATNLLMSHFYKNYLHNMDMSYSLLSAQNSLRNTKGFEDYDNWAGWILLDALN